MSSALTGTNREAADGKEAVEKYAENEPDLIFMDIHMPILNGFEATRKIREYEAGKKRTPIIALTADAFKDDKDKCVSEGMDFILPKPFSPAEIVNVIRRFAPAGSAWMKSDRCMRRWSLLSVSFKGKQKNIGNLLQYSKQLGILHFALRILHFKKGGFGNETISFIRTG